MCSGCGTVLDQLYADPGTARESGLSYGRNRSAVSPTRNLARAAALARLGDFLTRVGENWHVSAELLLSARCYLARVQARARLGSPLTQRGRALCAYVLFVALHNAGVPRCLLQLAAMFDVTPRKLWRLDARYFPLLNVSVYGGEERPRPPSSYLRQLLWDARLTHLWPSRRRRVRIAGGLADAFAAHTNRSPKVVMAFVLMGLFVQKCDRRALRAAAPLCESTFYRLGREFMGYYGQPCERLLDARCL